MDVLDFLSGAFEAVECVVWAKRNPWGCLAWLAAFAVLAFVLSYWVG